MKTLSDYLEANFGALKNDSRIVQIGDYIKSDIKNIISKIPDAEFGQDQVKNSFVFRTKTKYKHQSEIGVKITWGLKYREISDGQVCNGGYHYELPRGSHTIVLWCNPNKTKEEFLSSLKSGDVDKWLLHEVKHMLDYLDGIFTKKDNYIDAETNFKKYVLQDKEKDAFLISTIEELESIRRQQPNITFEKALVQSPIWQSLKNRAFKDTNKINKFKGKLLNYWNRNNQEPNKNLTPLKDRLMRYLHSFHKGQYNLNQLKKIVSRFNTEQELLNAIEYVKGKI